jgi:hypothetical protein
VAKLATGNVLGCGDQLGALARRNRRERLLRRVDDAPVLDGPRHAQAAVLRTVELREVAAHVGGGEALDVLSRSDDALSERVILEREAARDVVRVDLDAILVVVLVDLLEDQGALELDLREPRARQQLAEEHDAGRDVRRLECELEQRVVAAGLGLQRRAEVLDRGVEGERCRVLLGPAKQHVLDEVGQPVVLGGLEPGPHLHEHRAHRRVEVGQCDCRHGQSVAQRRCFDLRVDRIHDPRLTTD